MATPICAHCGDIPGGCVYCKWKAARPFPKTGGRMASIKWGSSAWVDQYIAEHGFPPIAGGSEDATEEESDAAEQAANDATEDTANESGSTDESKSEDVDWKAMARKHEREAKKARKEAESVKKALDERAEQDKTEQEKAMDKARKEGADEAVSTVEQKYRSKIKNAEIRAQAAGRFADPSDAVALAQIEDEDLFDDDGEINPDAIKSALDSLLESKPHLAAGQGARFQGGSDAGKGSGDAKDVSSWGVEDHLKDVQKRRGAP